MPVNEDDGDGAWNVFDRDVRRREPAFPPPQLPVDIRVEAAERAVVALGANRLHDAYDEGFRVFADPAGHPFCLVF